MQGQPSKPYAQKRRSPQRHARSQSTSSATSRTKQEPEVDDPGAQLWLDSLDAEPPSRYSYSLEDERERYTPPYPYQRDRVGIVDLDQRPVLDLAKDYWDLWNSKDERYSKDITNSRKSGVVTYMPLGHAGRAGTPRERSQRSTVALTTGTRARQTKEQEDSAKAYFDRLDADPPIRYRNIVGRPVDGRTESMGAEHQVSNPPMMSIFPSALSISMSSRRSSSAASTGVPSVAAPSRRSSGASAASSGLIASARVGEGPPPKYTARPPHRRSSPSQSPISARTPRPLSRTLSRSGTLSAQSSGKARWNSDQRRMLKLLTGDEEKARLEAWARSVERDSQK